MNVSISGQDHRCIIYVHGRGFKPGPETLLDLILAALSAGVERDFPEHLDDFRAISKRLAYYGDHTNALMAGLGEHYDEQLDIGDCRNSLQQLKALDRRKRFSLSNYDKLPGKSAMPEFAVGVAAPLLGSVGLGGKLAGKVAPDLAAYWKKDGQFAESVRSSVRTAVCDALREREEILLLAHGTGSVIVWDVLWQLSHDDRFSEYDGKKIDTLVTLGSPLGDMTVRRRLLGAREKVRRKFPCNIVTWHNVSAEDDWMCHDNTLADDYKGMLRQKQVSAIRDYRIYNLAVRYGRSSPHSSLGYLIHPRVAQIIVDWLARPDLEPPPKHIF